MMINLKPMKMEHGNCPYGDLELTPADNGHKVTYYEKTSKPGSSMYDQMERKRCEYVYGTKELSKAVAKYKEISDCIMKYKGKLDDSEKDEEYED